MDKQKIYKGQLRATKVPCCAIELSHMQRLFDFISDFNENAVKRQIDAQVQNTNESDDDFEKRKELIKQYLIVTVQVLSSKGDVRFGFDKSIFVESTLPDTVEKVIIDNYSLYQSTFNLMPTNTIKIEFDFSKPKLFDFTTSPSYATANQSSLSMQGEGDNVVGTFEQIMSSLEDRTSKWAWLHKANTYDLILWFFIAPIMFWNLYKLEPAIGRVLTSSAVFNGAVYVYLLIAMLWVYRIFFNAFRWLFPYLELRMPTKKGPTALRALLGTVFLAAVGPSLSGFLKFLFHLIF